MTWRPIGDAKVGDALVGFTDVPGPGRNRILERSVVEHVWKREAPTVELQVGSRRVVASNDHKWLAQVRPWWRETARLNLGARLRLLGDSEGRAAQDTPDYQAGYIAGVTQGDGTFRWDPAWRSDKLGYPQSYWRVAVLATDRPILDRLVQFLAAFDVNVEVKPFTNSGSSPMLKVEARALGTLAKIAATLEERSSAQWRAGWLAGMFDTDGMYDKNLRISQRKDNGVLERVEAYGSDLGFTFKIERWERACPTARLAGDVDTRIRFLTTIAPALQRKCNDFYGRLLETPVGEVTGLRRGPVRELIDIQTSTGTFVAEGICTHNCYALTLAKRLKAMGSAKYQNDGDPRTSGPGFELTVHPDALRVPYKWRSPRTVFVNSMSDLFHARVPLDFVRQVFEVMADTPQHTYQVLTKRARRLRQVADRLEWPANVWMGVSVETGKELPRVDDLREVPAAVRFLSCEPLLGPLDGLDLAGIDWVIAGGESGAGHRPLDEHWVTGIRDACLEAEVAFFFKQWGGRTPKAGGRLLEGRTWDQLPLREPVSSH
ncbi:phage Gp37/Gp68 family protein [Streptomyces sp. NPDC002668]|uniref:DUF5131 family protein n=1 Tax=Streptomyces sp. NPDC002668 TaxID=3154422 RepID=UPI0033230706